MILLSYMIWYGINSDNYDLEAWRWLLDSLDKDFTISYSGFDPPNMGIYLEMSDWWLGWWLIVHDRGLTTYQPASIGLRVFAQIMISWDIQPLWLELYVHLWTATAPLSSEHAGAIWHNFQVNCSQFSGHRAGEAKNLVQGWSCMDMALVVSKMRM